MVVKRGQKQYQELLLYLADVIYVLLECLTCVLQKPVPEAKNPAIQVNPAM